MRLPVNPKLENDLRTLEIDQAAPAKSWAALLDERSIHKLLYNLQIVQNLQKENQDWTEDF